MNILVAVICIIFLILLLAKIYNSYTEKKDLDKAKENLKTFINEYNSFLNDPLANEKEFIFFGPVDWTIYFFSIKDKELYPESCSLNNKYYDNCVCICYGEDIYNCNEKYKGICYELEYEWLNKDKDYEIKNIPFAIIVKKEIK